MSERTAFLILALALSATPLLADSGSVVFGSYSDTDNGNAESYREDLRYRFGIAVELVEVYGTPLHRLMTPALDETVARSLIDRVSESGVSAWYLQKPPGETKTPVVHTETNRKSVRDALVPVLNVASVAPELLTETHHEEQAIANSMAIPLVLQTASDEHIEVPFFDDIVISIDGRVDEAVWQKVRGYNSMLVMDPDTLEKPKYSTTSRFFYTSDGLYVSAVMEQPVETLVSRLSSRDKYINRDAYGITLDTTGEGLYGYWFVVNLGGSLMDGKVVPERSLSEQWDGPWLGESARLDNGWSAELFLPWSMMSLPDVTSERKMGFWIDRKVAHMDERYGWPALPFTASRFLSALQPMHLQGLETGQQFAVFPYTSATLDQASGEQEVRVGADVSWRPSSNLQLTATLNPDFGAVESDDVVVNLTSFETFFPEKRLFFLEGNEVFITTPRSDVNRYRSTRRGAGARPTPSTFTPEPTTLFNTRRIGGAPGHVMIPDGTDVAPVERGKPTDLLGAVKVVGSKGGFRYGVLGAFEDEVELMGTIDSTGVPVVVNGDGRNFGVVRGLYESVGSNRKSIGYIGTVVTLPGANSMTHGIDTHMLSSNGKVKWDTQFMYSDANNIEGYGAFTDITYTQRRGLLHRFSFDYVDDKLDISDLGFIRQNDYVSGQYGLVRSTSQGLDYFRFVRNSLFISAQTNTEGFLTRMGIFTNQTMLFPNSNQLRFELDYYPERWDDRNSRGNGMFKTDSRWFTQIGFGTDSAKNFSWSGTIGAEQEELDGNWTYSSDFGITYTPNGRFTFDLDIRFKKRNGWLVHQTGRDFTTYDASDFQPRFSIDYFFSAKQQFRMTLQWAGIKAEALDYWQVPENDGELIRRPAGASSEDFTLSRLTAQVRYRWELGPLSDLFVVYTRGSKLIDDDIDVNFNNLFSDAISEPIVDFFVVKLRYRFGT